MRGFLFCRSVLSRQCKATWNREWRSFACEDRENRRRAYAIDGSEHAFDLDTGAVLAKCRPNTCKRWGYSSKGSIVVIQEVLLAIGISGIFR